MSDERRSGEGVDENGSDIAFHRELLGDDVLPPAVLDKVREQARRHLTNKQVEALVQR